MARIIIMDDNRTTGTLLKKALEREDHQVRLVNNWKGLTANTRDSSIDLVLIHQSHQNNNGWTAFNQFKRTYPQIPAMLYVFPDYRWTSANWIVKAVQESLPTEKESDQVLPLWTWETGLNIAGTVHLKR